MTQWNDRKMTGMSFEAVCKLLLETEGESLNSERTEARVELIRLVSGYTAARSTCMFTNYTAARDYTCS